MPLVASSVNGFWKRLYQTQADFICLSVLNQARAPLFYEKWEVPDTLEGRFDCAVLHLALLLRYIKGTLAQAVFDSFFSYIELTLREIGVSDLRVGKQVKNCAKFFYGALKAYNIALDFGIGLEGALFRNLYGGTSSTSLEEMAEYVRHCDSLLEKHNFEQTKLIPWPSLEEKRSQV